MSKNKKKGVGAHLRPPLSFTDKLIYYILITVSGLLAIVSIFFFEDLRDLIAFADENTLAYQKHFSIILSVLPIIYPGLSGVIFFAECLSYKKPVFGNKGVKYGEYPWRGDLYPVAGKMKKKNSLSPNGKALRKRFIVIWCAGLAVSAAVGALGLAGRDCLTAENSIVSYSCLGVRTDEFTPNDYSRLTVGARHIGGRFSSGWEYYIIVKTAASGSFTFSNRDYTRRGADPKTECLEKMSEIKALFSTSSVTVEGAENVEKVIDHLGMNERQSKMMYELFDLPQK